MQRIFGKRIFFSLLISACIILSGCGGQPEESVEEPVILEESKDISETATVEISDDIAAAEPVPYDELIPTPEEPEEEPVILDDTVVDLTTMSSTMVYGQVYNMMYYPEKFIGKTVKMKGLYSDYFDQALGKHYYACIIMDATACCAQGVEFILTDDYKYPDDYPEDGDEITVEGTFDVYEEDGGSYCTLRNASLLSG